MSRTDRRVVRTIHAGDAEADGRGNDAPIADRLRHHRVQALLDLQLSHGLKIGAFAARACDDLALLVREQAHGLRAPRIDADDMVHAALRVCDHSAAARKGAPRCSR